MFLGELIKIKSNHDNLRTKSVLGHFNDYPKLEKSFILYSDSLSLKDGFRIIKTTPVKDINIDGDSVYFKTSNSVYKLMVFDNVECN